MLIATRQASRLVEIVGVLIATGDGEDPGLEEFRQIMIDARLITPVANGASKTIGDAELPFRLAQQQQATVGRQVTAIETRCELLGERTAGRSKFGSISSVMAGVAFRCGWQ